MEYLQLLLQGLQRAVDFASSFTTYLLGDDPHPGAEDPRNAKERRNDGNCHDCEVETTHDGTNISPREHLEIFGGPLTTEEIQPDLKIQVTLGAAVHGAPPTESIPELAKQSSTNEGWEDSEEKLSELVFPKPSIFKNPSEAVAEGENVSIYCKSEGFQNAEFTLQKSQYLDAYQTVETKVGEGQFPIVSINASDAGIYRCRYCLKSESAFHQRCSNYSDSVYLQVTGHWRPKPFIEITPGEEVSPGSNVTIECQGPWNDLNFLLLKSNQVTASKGAGQGRNATTFHLSNVTQEDEGNYTCHYCKTNEFLCSVPSDPTELHLTDDSQINPRSLHFASLEIWIRFGVSAVVILALVLILAEATYSRRKEQRFQNID